MRREAWACLDLGNWRRVPFARERIALWGIEAHGQIERSLRRRQSVCLLVRARALVLEIKIKRSVRAVWDSIQLDTAKRFRPFAT